MKKVSVLLLFVLTASAATARDYTYSQKIKDISCKVSVKITEENDIKDIFATDDYYLIVNEVKVKKDDGVFEWNFKDPKNDSELKAVRDGNRIIINGRYKGKELKKEHYIDDRPWHQLFTWELDHFLLSKETRLEFWAIRPDNPESAGILVAYKDKEEKLMLNGEEVDAINAKVTLAGLLSIFWTGDYWYRKSDGFYIRSKPMGDALVELNKEK